MGETAVRRPTVGMVYDNLATFVKRDIRILERDFEVVSLHFNPRPKALLAVRFLQQCMFILRNRRRIDAYIHQSAGYLSFLPCITGRLLGHRNIIVAIGTDSARLPEIGYGHFCKWPLRWFAAVSFRRADIILPVHRSLAKDTYRYTDIAHPQQGFQHLVPRLRTPVVEIVNGYDGDRWKVTKPWSERKPAFLSVAVKLGRAGFYRKGIDVILATAHAHPEWDFTLVTAFPQLETVPPNVQVIPPMPQEALLEVYNDHQFYVQLSMFEGFPNAICEAMQCGCVPIGSDVAGIPDIIGSTGFIVPRKGKKELAAVIERALSGKHLPKERPEMRIAQHFPLERRTKELIAQVTEQLDTRG